MKAKIVTLTLIGLVAGRLAVAQTDSPAPVPPADSAITVAQATPVAEPTPVATEPAPPAAPTTPHEGVVIPLIQFQDVPLTTAIENLARQASLNYILDPKVGYGQPDERNVVKAQPNISIRWENLTAGQALNALLNNYGLQLLDDPKTKISRVTVKDPAAPDPLVTKVIQLKFAAPSNLIASVQTSLTDKRSKVIGDVRTSQLVVLATEKELVNVDEIVTRLDSPPKQVLIEARLLETSLNPSTIKGIDWSGTLEAQNFSFGNNLQQKPVTQEDSVNQPLSTVWPKLMFDTAKGFNPATAFLDADGVNAVLSFLNKDADAKVIATPRAVTLDNETANLSVTRAVPIFKNTAGTQGSPGGSEVAYTNLGTILQVTPRISANNFVNLRVIPEVSSVFRTVQKIVAGTVNQADEYDIRRIDTHVMIPSGNTLVLGGLVSDRTNKDHTKVPLLGDLPGIGLAFRRDRKERQQSNLLIFITPTIVADMDFHPTQTDFLQTKFEEPDQKEWSAWDSGKPVDWSKPIKPQYFPNSQTSAQYK